jgi:exopolyphosphatase / guanosine-5'-triphosphate,3'-diphosphate pyrophosphatase
MNPTSTRRRSSPGRSRAVIDLGSNTGRIVVFRSAGHASLEIVWDSKVPLRLIRELDARGRLKPKGIDRTLRALRDFRAVAEGTGASRVLAVATSAAREVADGPSLIRCIRRETGVRVRILDAEAEARLAFLGAVYGLPVRHGLLVDLGGGSLQIVRFRDRRLLRSWSLPLGALRLSDQFIASRRPSAGMMRKLRAHLNGRLKKERIPALAADECLIGTGGTIRNLAKIESRHPGFPILRLHGHVLTRGRLGQVASLLTARRPAALVSLPGLSKDRAESITAGCVTVETVMDLLGARELLVSGQGLREGLLLDEMGRKLPGVGTVRRTSMADLSSRFASWNAVRAERRADLAERFFRRLEGKKARDMRELLGFAAQVLDIGRSIDYYQRHQHAAMILRSTNLLGFSHREIALLSAVVEFAGDPGASLKRYRPLLSDTDHRSVLRAGVVMALADEIEHRLPSGDPVRVRISLRSDSVVLRSPALEAWDPRRLAERFRGAFGRDLRIGA